MNYLHITRRRLALTFFALNCTLVGCGGGSDSSGTAVGSDEDVRASSPSNEALIAQANIRDSVDDIRSKSLRTIRSINDAQNTLSEDIRPVSFENQLEVEILSLNDEVLSSILEIIDGRDLTRISELLYSYLFDAHTLAVESVALSEADELDVSPQAKVISSQRARAEVFSHYCTVTLALETNRILKREELPDDGYFCE